MVDLVVLVLSRRGGTCCHLFVIDRFSIFFVNFFQKLFHSSGNDNPRDGSVIFQRSHSNLNSILFQMIRDSDFTYWADLCTSSDPTYWNRIVLVSGVCVLSTCSSTSAKSMVQIMDRHGTVSRTNLSLQTSCFARFNHFYLLWWRVFVGGSFSAKVPRSSAK